VAPVGWSLPMLASSKQCRRGVPSFDETERLSRRGVDRSCSPAVEYPAAADPCPRVRHKRRQLACGRCRTRRLRIFRTTYSSCVRAASGGRSSRPEAVSDRCAFRALTAATRVRRNWRAARSDRGRSVETDVTACSDSLCG
jgi:hypothetical protein